MTSPCRSPARNSMVSSRSQTGAWPSRSLSARRAIAWVPLSLPPRGRRQARTARPGREVPLDGGDQQLPDAGTTLLVELADPGGARDVDLGHEPTDHVEPDEQHAFRGERRADLAREPAVAIVERAGDPGRAGGEVAPMILRRRYAGERVRHRLAVDEQHACIARLDDVGDVALHQREALAMVGESLEHHAGIRVTLAEHEDRAPAHAVERLADDPALLAQEGRHLAHVARDQGRRAALREPRRA